MERQPGKELVRIAVDAGHPHIFVCEVDRWHQEPMDHQLG